MMISIKLYTKGPKGKPQDLKYTAKYPTFQQANAAIYAYKAMAAMGENIKVPVDSSINPAGYKNKKNPYHDLIVVGPIKK